MDLRQFRHSQNLTLDRAAEQLGLTGEGRPTAFRRLETGEVPVDADLGARIVDWSGGAVTFAELMRTRLEFLQRTGKARPFAPTGSAA